MKSKILIFVLCLAFTANTAFALTGKEIMQKSDALPEGKTSVQDSVLLIVKGERKEKKEFNGVSKKYGKKTRKRITFTSPTRMEFLVWDEPGKDGLQWIKLTSGKVRKIASSDKGNPWVNSHFYNEDISDNNVDDFGYKLLGEADVEGVKCYKIESHKKIGTKVYSKRILYVGKNDYVLRKVDFYIRGMFVKTLTMLKIEKIQGIYTSRKMVMKRTDGKGKSILYLRSVKYNTNVSDHKLKRESF